MAENNSLKISVLGAFLHWLKLHSQNARQALTDLGNQPVSSTLTVAVIGIALALPATLNVLVQNGRNLAGGWEGMRDFSVYLTQDQTLGTAQTLADEIGNLETIAEVRITTADDALEEFRAGSGLDAVIDTLAENPLPHTLIVRPVDSATPDQIGELSVMLDQRDIVDVVKFDMLWVQRLNAILAFLQRAMLIAASMLVLAVIIIIGNTIRLDIQNRSDEIEILKLLGASNGFVRRPFLYMGLWYGLLGSAVALVLLFAGSYVLAEPLQRLIGLYESQLQLLGLDADAVLALIAGGVLAGWGGAWLAVSRHLSRIQPR